MLNDPYISPGMIDSRDTPARQAWADYSEEHEAELAWLVEEIAPRTPLSPSLVWDVLRLRDRVLAEADEFASPGQKREPKGGDA